MTARELIAAFEVLAEAPDGVKRLRELVLQLAVRGKLVPQEAGDEPASVLLERIAAEKARLVKEGKIRKAEMAAPVKAADVPFDVPAGWCWVRLEAATINRDSERIPLSSDVRASRRGSFDYYGASGVIDKIDAFLFDKPLLLVGEDGANLVLRSTPIAFIASGEYWVNNHAHVLDSVELATLRFLVLAVNAMDLKPFLTGTAQPKLNQARMNGIPIPLPPLAEQHRIVARVDGLMGLLDRLEAARKASETTRAAARDAALAALRDAETPEAVEVAWNRIADQMHALFTEPSDLEPLRQAVLQLAVRGRLVRQNPEDKPASVLEPVTGSERVPSIESMRPWVASVRPERWNWSTIGGCCDCRLGKMLDAQKNSGNPRVYLRNTNVHWFRFELSDLKEMLLEDHEIADLLLRPGDVLVCEGGHGIGRSAVWRGQVEGVVFQKALHRCRPSEAVLGDYVAYWMSVLDSSGALQMAFTGAGIPHLTGRALQSLPIPLPPLAEQHRIVAKVDALMALIDQLEARLTAAVDLHAQFAAAAVHHLDT